MFWVFTEKSDFYGEQFTKNWYRGGLLGQLRFKGGGGIVKKKGGGAFEGGRGFIPRIFFVFLSGFLNIVLKEIFTYIIFYNKLKGI